MLLFIGILFSLIGVVLAFTPIGRKKLFFLLPLVLGLAVIYLHTFGPLADKEKKLNDILNINSNNIVELHIYPGVNTNAKSLVKSAVLINKQAFLSDFASALNKGKSSNEFNQNPQWTCKIEILKKDQKSAWLEVSRQGLTTLIRPLSSKYGWDYGTIRADEFGNLLVQIAK